MRVVCLGSVTIENRYWLHSSSIFYPIASFYDTRTHLLQERHRCAEERQAFVHCATRHRCCHSENYNCTQIVSCKLNDAALRATCTETSEKELAVRDQHRRN